MQTLLFISSDENILTKKIEEIQKQYSISHWDTHVIQPEPSIGIEDVRRVKTLTARRPFAGSHSILVIRDIHKATVEAQNALLKILEEPPLFLTIVLTAPQDARILPTILSRCHISRLSETAIPERTLAKIHKTILTLLTSSPGERLLAAQKRTTGREETLQFLQEMTHALHGAASLPNGTPGLSRNEIAQILKKLHATLRFIEGNVNYKATLDVFLLGLPKVEM